MEICAGRGSERSSSSDLVAHPLWSQRDDEGGSDRHIHNVSANARKGLGTDHIQLREDTG